MLTQEQLATACECDVKTIRKAEGHEGRVDLRIVLALARALDCDVRTLLPQEQSGTNSVDQNLQMVLRWHEAFLSGDLESLLELHTEDSILEIPAAKGLPAAEDCQGIEQLRDHLTQIFQVFRVVSVRDDDFEIHAVDQLVFLRTTATIEFLPTGKSYTARHLNEFECRDGKIARRAVIADYDKLRQAMEE